MTPSLASAVWSPHLITEGTHGHTGLRVPQENQDILSKYFHVTLAAPHQWWDLCTTVSSQNLRQKSKLSIPTTPKKTILDIHLINPLFSFPLMLFLRIFQAQKEKGFLPPPHFSFACPFFKQNSGHWYIEGVIKEFRQLFQTRLWYCCKIPFLSVKAE